MAPGFAERFARDWIEAWNAHDLARVLDHYDDDFEMSSPIIVSLMGEVSGRLKGRDRVGAYWALALERVPDLRFELITVLAGVESVTVYYRSRHRGLAAEVFHFSPTGKVRAAFAHYDVHSS
jgi:hypothetical protein